MTLVSSSYGKAGVRTMRVHRDGGTHAVRELSTDVVLHGAFDGAYTHADNRAVIATDSIKNVINIIARENLAADAEAFCLILAARFLDSYAQVARVEVSTRETRWSRLSLDGKPHPHGFVLDANGTPTVQLDSGRDGAVLWSGINGFTFLKSGGSGWSDFFRDGYTTLGETQDRIAATSMDATWLWSAPPDDTAATSARILDAMLAVFADSYSHGMQDSLYRMGMAALDAVPAISEIGISCPNKHYLPIDLSAFGLQSDNCVFTPTDEPHGQIACVVRR